MRVVLVVADIWLTLDSHAGLVNRALTSFTFSGDKSGWSDRVTLEVSMTEADISNKVLESSGAIMAAAFIPRME